MVWEKLIVIDLHLTLGSSTDDFCITPNPRRRKLVIPHVLGVGDGRELIVEWVISRIVVHGLFLDVRVPIYSQYSIALEIDST